MLSFSTLEPSLLGWSPSR